MCYLPHFVVLQHDSRKLECDIIKFYFYFVTFHPAVLLFWHGGTIFHAVIYFFFSYIDMAYSFPLRETSNINFPTNLLLSLKNNDFYEQEKNKTKAA